MTFEAAEARARAFGAPRSDVRVNVRAPMLAMPALGLATPADPRGLRVLGDPAFVFELKLDGVRIVADRRAEDTTLWYRKGRNATPSYPDVRDAVDALGKGRLVLDGEVVAFDAAGKPSFDLLARRIHASEHDVARLAERVPAAYMLFDVLAVGPYDLGSLSLEARKSILGDLLEGATPRSILRLHPSLDDGRALFAWCVRHGLEGVVAKRRGSPYRWGERSADWIKVKTELEGDFVVVGWTEGEGDRAPLGALDIAAYEEGELIVCGSVGSGLGAQAVQELRARLDPLEVPHETAVGRYPAKPNRRHHVRPELVVSVRYASVTNDGALRHPVFRGLRPDADPRACVRPSSASARTAPRAPIPIAASSPVRAAARQKGVLRTYYRGAAPFLLPLVKDRPCLPLGLDPSGRRGLAPVLLEGPWPSWFRRTTARFGGDEHAAVFLDDVEGLEHLVARGVVSFRMVTQTEHTAPESDVCAVELRGNGARDALVRWLEASKSVPFPMGAAATSASAIDVLVPVRGPTSAVLVLAQLLQRWLEAPAATTRAVTDLVVPYALVMEGGRLRVSLPLDRSAGASRVARIAAEPRTLEGALRRFPERSDTLANVLASPADLAKLTDSLARKIAPDRGSR